ncbi:MAG: dTDP-4-dehydrorhamnose reductase [Motiliproteus sp.]|jgi:dTDP-4-dehydrorhamnose reductase
MKVLLTGAEGQLGRCFQDRCTDYLLIALNRAALDISDLNAVRAALARHQPDLIVNAAAYTAVDRAEQEVDRAFAVNRTGPENLALGCAEQGIALIHISTDYVFDGTASTAATSGYKPDSPVSPLGVYGQSKWQGEEAVRRTLDKHLIIRTAWVFSEYGNNFVKTMLRLGSEREQLSVVNDQWGCPTYAGQLADAVLALLPLVKQPGFKGWGTQHFVGDRALCWQQFAETIFTEAQALGVINNIPSVLPISTAQYPTPARRPAYSVLDTGGLKQLLQDQFANDWQQGLRRVLAKLSA